MLYTAFAFLLSAATTVLAQDVNSAFITSCGPKTFALTFDDGPSPFTPELLGILDAAKVKATFFVLGVQLNKAELRVHTKAAFDAGHMIAAHSMDHTDFNSLTVDQIAQQAAQNNAEIKKTIGVETNYFRPPFGNCSTTCAATMKQLGYTVVQWNVDSNDWRVVGTPNEASAFDAFPAALNSPTASTVGHISLQHDIHQFSVKMVPKIIETIKAAGKTFVTVDKCQPNLPPAYRGATTTPTPAPTVAPKPKSSGSEMSSASVLLVLGSVLGTVMAAAL